jgi:hypothetical protein
MARWRLTAPHYLNVEGTVWEYREVDRTTGRPKRTQFPVPLLLDPTQPSDWTHRIGMDDGDVCVSDGKNPDPKDIIYTGSPTPDMQPLDDEAMKISKSLESSWKHPIESLPGTFSQHLLDGLQNEVASIQANQAKSAPVEGMTELLTAMTAMMKQNQEMMAILASKPVPASASLKRA